MKRLATTAVVAATAVALASAAAARAHVSLHPNLIPAGAFATVDVRVPGEQPGAYAYRVIMQMPPGFTEVDVEDIPGWSAAVTTTALRRPLQTPDGAVDEEVSRVTWNGDRSALGRIPNGHFVQFPIELTMPAYLAGRALTFKTVELYSNGQNAYWIGPPSAAFPAPTLDVTRAGGVIEDVAGGESGPAPGFVPVAAAGGDGSDTLAIVAIALAALALLASGATLRARRRRP